MANDPNGMYGVRVIGIVPALAWFRRSRVDVGDATCFLCQVGEGSIVCPGVLG
jgi:hypothetical protein